MEIRFIETQQEREQAFHLLAELRTELLEQTFRQRLPALLENGYQLVGLFDEGALQGLSGFRILEGGWGWKRYLYVDELVVHPDCRSKGYGAALVDWLLARARESDCHQIQLDSGVQRFRAHRFYLNKNFRITHHHFRLELNA